MKDKSEVPRLFFYEDDDTELIPSRQSSAPRPPRSLGGVVARKAEMDEMAEIDEADDADEAVKIDETAETERVVSMTRHSVSARHTKTQSQPTESAKPKHKSASGKTARTNPINGVKIVAIPVSGVPDWAYSWTTLFWLTIGLITILGFSVEHHLKITDDQPTISTYHLNETPLKNLFRSAER